MIKITKKQKEKCDYFLKRIERKPSEWTSISIRLSNIHASPPTKIQRLLLEFFCEKEGFSIITNDHRILLIINEYVQKDYPPLKKEITNHLSGHQHRVIIQQFTSEILEKLKRNLNEIESIPERSLYNEREERNHNTVLIADDDQFIRTVLKKLLSKYADIHEVDNGNDVIEAYKQYNPDIAILDIHMPEKNGIELIKDIFEVDQEPFIIISSADSVKENVIASISNGAAGFLSKPIQNERLFRLVDQCLTHQSN